MIGTNANVTGGIIPDELLRAAKPVA